MALNLNRYSRSLRYTSPHEEAKRTPLPSAGIKDVSTVSSNYLGTEFSGVRARWYRATNWYSSHFEQWRNWQEQHGNYVRGKPLLEQYTEHDSWMQKKESWPVGDGITISRNGVYDRGGQLVAARPGAVNVPFRLPAPGSPEAITFATKPGKPVNPRILVVGDSLSAQDDMAASFYGKYGSWAKQLQAALANSKSPYQLLNYSRSGQPTIPDASWNAEGGMNALNLALAQNPDPAMVVIQIGANDARLNVRPEQMKANIERMIKKVLFENPNSKVLVVGLSLPPVLREGHTPEDVRAYADAYPVLGQEFALTGQVGLIENIYAPIMGNPPNDTTLCSNLGDGVHPLGSVEGEILSPIKRKIGGMLGIAMPEASKETFPI